MMNFWSLTRNLASSIAPIPQMMFRTPAMDSRMPANTHQPLTLDRRDSRRAPRSCRRRVSPAFVEQVRRARLVTCPGVGRTGAAGRRFPTCGHRSDLDDAGAPFVSRAATYDRLVRSRSTTFASSAAPSDFARFAAGASNQPRVRSWRWPRARRRDRGTAARSARPTVLIDLSARCWSTPASRIAGRGRRRRRYRAASHRPGRPAGHFQFPRTRVHVSLRSRASAPVRRSARGHSRPAPSARA